MKHRRSVSLAVSALALVCIGGYASAAEVDAQRLLNADKDPNNWLSYHGSYKSWHYSGLNQINTGNVAKLQVAWSHVASRANRGLPGFPAGHRRRAVLLEPV